MKVGKKYQFSLVDLATQSRNPFTKLLAWILCLLVPLPSGGFLVHAADPQTPSTQSTPPPQELFQPELPLTYPTFDEVFLKLLENKQRDAGIQKTQLAIDDGLNLIEAGKIDQLEAERRDFFHLGEQKLFINEQEYSLKNDQLEIPLVSFNKIETSYNSENRVLSFLAIKNGRVTARHEIHNIDVASFTEDEEHLLILSSKGQLSAIDKFILSRVSLFKAPIPIFQNLAKDIPVKTEEGYQIKINFRHPGFKPFEELNSEHPDHDKIILPKNDNGELIISSKDTLVYSENSQGDRHLHAILSKNVTYEKVQEGILVLSWLGFLAYLNLAPPEEQAELVETWLSQRQLPSLSSLNKDERGAINNFSPSTLSQFLGRYKATELLKKRNFDLVRPEEWQKQFDEISGFAKAQLESKHDRSGFKHSEEFIEKLDQESQNNKNYEETWLSVVGQSEKANIARKARKAFMGLGTMLGLGAASLIGYQAAPENIKQTLDYAKQLQIMNWIYSFWPSDIWANAEYRLPLIMSITCLIGTLPLGLFLSWASVPLLRNFAKWTRGWAPKLSALLQEKHDIYAEMGVSKRILTVGMRVCSWITLPIQHAILDKAFRQKFLFPAIRRGINPFKKINKDSELGKILKLEHNHFAGFNIPGSTKKSSEKEKILLALSLQKKNAERLSNLFALLIISEKYKVSPQKLLDFMSGENQNKAVKEFLENSESQTEWLELKSRIASKLLKHDELASGQIEALAPDQFAKMFKESLDLSETLSKRSTLKLKWDRLLFAFSNKSKSMTKPLVTWMADHGKFEHEFLKTAIPTDFTTRQVSWAYMIDQGLTIFYSSFYGARADVTKLADPAHAKTLAADIHGNIFNLYTNREQLYDVVYNGMDHLIGSSSNNTLVFYQDMPFADSNYQPYESASGALASRNSTGEIQEKAESFWQSIKNGISSLHPKRSDLGGVYVRDFVSRLACVHFYVLLGFSIRLTAGGQGFEDAVRAFLYTFISTNWVYNWPWKLIYVATQGNEDKVKAFNASFIEAKEKVAQGIRLKNDTLLGEGYDSLFGLMLNDPSFKEEFTDSLLKNDEFQKNLNDEKTRPYLEAVRDLLFARQEKDTLATERAEQRLLEFFKSENIQLSGDALLKHAIFNPPQATKINPWFQKALIAGASILTTALAVPLVDKSFRPDELTGQFLLSNAALQAGLYGLFYILLGKKPYEYVSKKIKSATKAVTEPLSKAFCSQKLLP